MSLADSNAFVHLFGASGAGRVGTRGSVWPAVQQAFGLVFAGTLAWGVLAFPWVKGMPAGYAPVGLGCALAALVLRRRVAQAIATALGRPTERRFVAGVVLLAIVVRAVAVVTLGDAPVGDHEAYNRHALRILHGYGYGPTAYYPPGVSFWLAGAYAVFGERLLAAQLINALVGGLFTWLTYDVGRRVVDRPAARAAAVLAAVFPSLVLYATTLGYDPLLGCALMGTVALFLRRGPAALHPWWHVGAIGVVLGAATFLKPIGLLLPSVFGVAYWQHGASLRRSAFNTVVLAVFMAAVIAPWSVRNYRVLGEFVPVTTTGGVGLWVANNPSATGLSCQVPPVVEGSSEVERDRQLWRQAWRYIAAHPARFARTAVIKAAYLWGTSSTVMAGVSADRWSPWSESLAKLAINVAWVFVSALFVVAVVRGRVCSSPAVFWPLIALLAYLWGIHLFYEAQSRYHLPVLPVLFIIAGSALFDSGGPLPCGRGSRSAAESGDRR